MFVLDASVIVKWFNQEDFTEKSLGIREKFLEGEIKIVVPDLLVYELSNALRYNPNFRENEVKEAIDSIYNIGIDIVVPTLSITKHAIEISHKYNVSVYDSFYISLAKWIGFVYVTADNKLFQKVSELNFVKFIGDL